MFATILIRRLHTAAALLLCLTLAACAPELNWREVRTEPDSVRLLLPCKPDRGSRVVPFAGRDTELSLTGCDAAGLTFALASARLVRATNLVELYRSLGGGELVPEAAEGPPENPRAGEALRRSK